MVLSADEIIDALSRPLPIEDTYTRVESGRTLTYVSAEATIRWLNEHLAHHWSWIIDDYSLSEYPERTKGKTGNNGEIIPGSQKLQFMGVVQGTLSIYNPDNPEELLAARSGVGAGVNTDPDTAIKTATAEALKKASNQFGVALYLWHQFGRDRVEALRDGSIEVLQALLTDYAADHGAEQSADGVAEFFGVGRDSMRDITIVTQLVKDI